MTSKCNAYLDAVLALMENVNKVRDAINAKDAEIARLIKELDEARSTVRLHAEQDYEFEKRMMHDQYWRGYESALSTIKALVSGRIKAYENSTDEKNRERVEAFRDILLQDIASLEDTMKRLWRR